MGQAELPIGKVIEPLPVHPAILAEVHTSERGHDLSTWSGWVDLYAESAYIGARLVLISVQKETRMGHALHGIRTDGVVNSPTGRQMRPPHRTDALYRRIVPHSIDARPLLRARFETERLIPGAYIERTGSRRFWITKGGSVPSLIHEPSRLLR